MFAFDREFRLIAWNRAMQSISGLTREEALGKSALEVFPFLKETEVLEGKELVSENHPYGPTETDVFKSHYSPLLDDENNVVGGIAVITDITARKQAEEAANVAYTAVSFSCGELAACRRRVGQRLSRLALDGVCRKNLWLEGRRSDRQTRQRVAICFC